ncbi:hypothetical protein Mapa_005195 [Marchantia paleacea]|nr:hypothetical protein Mapa_005195 [Marchantia paleacea]
MLLVAQLGCLILPDVLIWVRSVAPCDLLMYVIKLSAHFALEVICFNGGLPFHFNCSCF